MYNKMVIDSCIVAVGVGIAGEKITEPEYNTIMQKIQSKPADPEGYQYKLRADTLEWELVDLPPVEPEPMTDEEALTRYANSITGVNDPDLISAAETMITKLVREE